MAATLSALYFWLPVPCRFLPFDLFDSTEAPTDFLSFPLMSLHCCPPNAHNDKFKFLPRCTQTGYHRRANRQRLSNNHSKIFKIAGHTQCRKRGQSLKFFSSRHKSGKLHIVQSMTGNFIFQHPLIVRISFPLSPAGHRPLCFKQYPMHQSRIPHFPRDAICPRNRFFSPGHHVVYR